MKKGEMTAEKLNKRIKISSAFLIAGLVLIILAFIIAPIGKGFPVFTLLIDGAFYRDVVILKKGEFYSIITWFIVLSFILAAMTAVSWYLSAKKKITSNTISIIYRVCLIIISLGNLFASAYGIGVLVNSVNTSFSAFNIMIDNRLFQTIEVYFRAGFYLILMALILGIIASIMIPVSSILLYDANKVRNEEPSMDINSELNKIKAYYDEGYLSEEQYEKYRNEIIEKYISTKH